MNRGLRALVFATALIAPAFGPAAGLRLLILTIRPRFRVNPLSSFTFARRRPPT